MTLFNELPGAPTTFDEQQAAYWCGRYEQCQRFFLVLDLDPMQADFVEAQAEMARDFARRFGIEITPATSERGCDMTPLSFPVEETP